LKGEILLSNILKFQSYFQENTSHASFKGVQGEPSCILSTKRHSEDGKTNCGTVDHVVV